MSGTRICRRPAAVASVAGVMIALWAAGAQAAVDRPPNAAAAAVVAVTSTSQPGPSSQGQGGEQGGSMQITVSIAPRPTPSGTTASPTATGAPSPTRTSPGGTLPRTGVAIGALVIAGTALVGGGAVLRMSARRRRDLRSL